MKSIFKPILKYYLKLIAKLVLVIHRPKIIVVAGSVNKTFVRDEIKRVLKKAGKNVRTNPRNFNTDIGLPLAVLNIPSGYGSYREWRPVIGKAFLALFQKNFPDYLILELGVSRVSDMRYLLTIIKPEISIITDITQRYLESFSDMNKLVSEYVYLVQKTQKSGAVILNHDNLRVKELAEKSYAGVFYFGETCEGENDWQIKEIEKTKVGQEVKVKHAEKAEKFMLPRFGKHHAYALAVALAVEDIISKNKKYGQD
jgi:UDP-N-acetylmuramoyl-tripeptide--D-alanyl-D-alanine ligase